MFKENWARLKIVCNPDVIVRAMAHRRLTLKDTANILGLTPAHAARLLRGKTTVNRWFADRLVRYFGDDAIYYTW